jgi:ferredoxin-thioredoxin reductase catalytic subunit
LSSLDKARQRAEADAKTNGCFLNPDQDFLKALLEGLVTNEERYGYPSCPCRLASGNFEFDRDIFCPCDYRDPDVAEFGACYCALYVRKDVFEGKTPLQPVPERRPKEKQDRAYGISQAAPITPKTAEVALKTEKKLWYCKQCGYVCYREDPPYICPVCKAKREFFAVLPT